MIYTYITGAVEYLTEAITYVPNFHSLVEREDDNTRQYGIKTSPSYNLVMNGSDVCRGDFPKQFSLLFKFKFDNTRFATTLFKVKGGFSVILDLCNFQVVLDYGSDSSCNFRNRTFSLRQELAANEWHKLGLAFTDDTIQMFVDCQLTDWSLFPGCSVQCNEDTTISMVTPSELSHCSSQGKVISYIQGNLDGSIRGF